MHALRTIGLCCLLACPAYAGTPLKAVATFSILGDMVKNVGKDKVDVTVLVGSDGDVHTFEPTPQEAIALVRARVIFENGLHFEHWLDDLYASSGSRASRIIVTDGIEPIALGNDEDPHVWHDVSNAMLMTERIRDGLIAADQVNAAYYRENAEKYLAELAKMDHWIIETLKDVPDERRKLVTSHDTFGYFAKRYGFAVIGTAVGSASTEAADPSAAEIAQLIEKIKAAGIRVVFAENTHNPKLLESVAAEAGVKLAPRLYTDALGPAGSAGDTYVKMMRSNAGIFAESLK
ncbi:MAG: zinc ABC transporter substrate-binding protein [Candidatus Omnitrophota bacterium]|nr:zinc ABC transporter substrate-binding protein [Candidatus Omnitrophota bacterium]